MYLKIRMAYNEDSKDLKEKLATIHWDMDSYNEDYYKDKKKAITFKASLGARKSPFVAFYYKDKLQKAFYAEDNSCNYENIIETINDWTFTAGKQGYIEIEQIEGTQIGRKEKGTTRCFMEGLSLLLGNLSSWYQTSNIVSIDWENNTFKTKNSVYRFKFHEVKRIFNESTNSK